MNALDATDAMLEAAIVATPVLTKKMLTPREYRFIAHTARPEKPLTTEKVALGNFFS